MPLKRFSFASVKLFYREYGQGQPLLIIHGIFGMSDNWTGIAQQLAKDFRVILPDLRNHGASPESNQMNFQLMAQDIDELRRSLGLEKIILAGHSLGGKVAVCYAGLFPQQLSQLVIMDIAMKKYEVQPQHFRLFEIIKEIDLENCKNRKEATKKILQASKDNKTRAILLKNMRKTAGHLEWKCKFQNIEQCLDELYDAVPDYLIEVPTLLLYAENSEYVAKQDAENLKKNFSKLKTTYILKAGHWLHVDCPEKIVEELRGGLLI